MILQELTLWGLAWWQGSCCINTSWCGLHTTKLALESRLVSYFIVVHDLRQSALWPSASLHWVGNHLIHSYWRQSAQQALRKCHGQPHLFLLDTSQLLIQWNFYDLAYAKHMLCDTLIYSKWRLKDNRLCRVPLCLALFSLLINFWTSNVADSQLRTQNTLVFFHS